MTAIPISQSYPCALYPLLQQVYNTKTMHIDSTVIQRKPVTDNFTIYNLLIHEYAFY